MAAFFIGGIIMWNYIWPMCLIVLSNVFYNLITKSTPSSVNPYLSLCLTYTVGAVVSLLVYFLSAKGASIAAELGKLNWTSYALGLSIVGLEAGSIYTYRAGWEISRGSLTANISLAVILLFVGLLFYKEAFNIKQLFGILFCVAGIVLLNGR